MAGCVNFIVMLFIKYIIMVKYSLIIEICHSKLQKNKTVLFNKCNKYVLFVLFKNNIQHFASTY